MKKYFVFSHKKTGLLYRKAFRFSICNPTIFIKTKNCKILVFMRIAAINFYKLIFGIFSNFFEIFLDSPLSLSQLRDYVILDYILGLQFIK